MTRKTARPRVTEPKPSRLIPEVVAARAKLFRNGRSQAVRLPREFRFTGDEVSIRRQGDMVILEPVLHHDWPAGYFDSWSASQLKRAPQGRMPAARRW